MFRLFTFTLAISSAVCAAAVNRFESDPPHCSNRVRDFYESHVQARRMRRLDDQLKHGQQMGSAETHFQIALAAWLADPLKYYERCGVHLDMALRLDPLHARARELALLHAIRAVERGDRYALSAALSHAQELLAYPTTRANKATYDKVLAICEWLETKVHGRKALRLMAVTALSAEQNPSRYLERTKALAVEFRLAIWEAEDTPSDLLEALLGETVLDTLERGLAMQGERLTALLMVGKTDQAIAEYRGFVEMLAGGINPTAEQDGTHLVVPSLELARKFTSFRDDPRLVEWLAAVRNTWIQGPSETVDWVDLLLAGNLEADSARAQGLWRTARFAFLTHRERHPPLVRGSTYWVGSYFSSLLGETPPEAY